jgi:hypothetical protein
MLKAIILCGLFLLISVVAFKPLFIPTFVRAPRRSPSCRQIRSLPLLSTKSSPPAETAPSTTSSGWIVGQTRIQDEFNYQDTVQRLYVRHSVLYTQEMAKTALQQYSLLLTNSSIVDPFARVVQLTTADDASREEGGLIGWIERGNQDFAFANELFRLKPKAGDIHILHSNNQYHVVQVLELWLNNNSVSTTTNSSSQNIKLGAMHGSNMVQSRRTLKGLGIRPQPPTHLRSYHIQTSGCQMNVADSERLAGVLHNELQLSVADNPKNADLILINTCSIRDKAEQKLYDSNGLCSATTRRSLAPASARD